MERDGAVLAEYTYDANGNRLSYTGSFGTAAGTYDDQDRLVAYGYTTEGSLSFKSAGGQTVTYGYDLLGSLRSVNLPSGIQIDYVIDGRGRRVGKKVNGSLVQGFLYRDSLRPSAELAEAGSVRSRFVYASRANLPDYMVKGGTLYAFVADHLGSPRLVVDVASGIVIQRLDYDEFGRILLDTNPGFQPFGFAGGLYDHQTALVRFGARDYDPEVGRWAAKDPIGFEGGDTNLYGYTFNDPINLTDPSGLDVYWCHAVADLPGNVFRFEHMWLKTDTKEAGLGQAGGNVPAEGEYRFEDNIPYFTQTEIVDHTGRSKNPGVTCEKLRPEFDEQCINGKLVVGKKMGRWSAFNQCQTFVLNVMTACQGAAP